MKKTYLKNKKTAVVYTGSRLHILLKGLIARGGEVRSKFIANKETSSSFIEKGLVYGLISRRTVPPIHKDVYYRITKEGMAALSCLEKVDSITMGDGKMIFSNSEPNEAVHIPIKINKKWKEYFEIHSW